ncbi:hypothetical protein ACIA8O_38835 [Kitasatospora sp. NPDC051853]|uniref:hypothetical protein n=1 Tax=Kitasatospora sp. NPDC051853 TaxID=3364058 RepID=UPI003793050E
MIIRDLVAAAVGVPYLPARRRFGQAGRRPVAVLADAAGLALALPWWPARAAAGAVYVLAAVRLWRLARRGSARTRTAAADLLTLLAPPAVTFLTGIHLVPALLRLLTTT